ncbi:MAG: hypothetical protein N2067_09460 [Spirochaetaceae bacterium]|nr:hypothetical protein [Spirochaetaceae bacterium]
MNALISDNDLPCTEPPHATADGRVVDHSRGEHAAAIIYPVVARRSHGLSLGINLFPARKICTYNCPYCEVQPFTNEVDDLQAGMVEQALRHFFEYEWPQMASVMPLKDICISGNGEPTCSPVLEDALQACDRVLRELEARDAAWGKIPVVLITNATGFLKPELKAMLARYAASMRLEIWAKLDGGTQELHRMLSGSAYRFEDIVHGITTFAREHPLTIQTMICRDSRSGRLLFDLEEYAAVIRHMRDQGAQLKAIQLYTLARPPVEPWVEGLEDAAMRQLGHALADQVPDLQISCYGRYQELEMRQAGSPMDSAWQS